jgi:hypothetical protein
VKTKQLKNAMCAFEYFLASPDPANSCVTMHARIENKGFSFARKNFAKAECNV